MYINLYPTKNDCFLENHINHIDCRTIIYCYMNYDGITFNLDKKFLSMNCLY